VRGFVLNGTVRPVVNDAEGGNEHSRCTANLPLLFTLLRVAVAVSLHVWIPHPLSVCTCGLMSHELPRTYGLPDRSRSRECPPGAAGWDFELNLNTAVRNNASTSARWPRGERLLAMS
jgi:hypothetical protein